MCQATGKRLNNYIRTKTTKEFLKEQNQSVIQVVQGGTPNKQGTWIHPKMLEHFIAWLNRSQSDQPEKTIQLQLQSELGGEVEVKTPVGSIDLLTDNEIIEIKAVKNWKTALGQILIYGKHYPNHQKHIHLFGKPLDSDVTLQIIEMYYADFGVVLTFEIL